MKTGSENRFQLERSASWTNRIDGFIELLKWPAAWVAALLTPLVIWSLLRLSWRVVTNPLPLVPFALGTLAFVFVWRRWLGKSRIGKFLITLEHESTHALFAVLTWHRIISFKASLGRGGQVRYAGRGNWLITASPYFFPTAALLLFLVAFFLPFPGLPWQEFLLGVALGYHLVSTYRETHTGQTDLHDLGWAFCWLFLPAANLAVVGLLISSAHQGTEGISLWVSDMMEPLELVQSWLTKLSQALGWSQSSESQNLN